MVLLFSMLNENFDQLSRWENKNPARAEDVFPASSIPLGVMEIMVALCRNAQRGAMLERSGRFGVFASAQAES
ncbi:hypothetical protein VL04_08900 [Chromobacterium violaceum]|uniref:hypothetical protein n=2 Tax=Chromobacterium violaceum TaxID=536 RepID=UPI0006543966|nr:hypothetical protein [Chromobacterium violaceum]KMN87457.1 hypothetical protein VL02_04270 [Chromobacterium violaceum]KMN90932.1 hypothetical protein VL04_08900 [Chromobacterium violaceum]